MKRSLFTLSIVLILLFVLVMPVFAQTGGNPSSPPAVQVTPDFIAVVAGAVLSLLFSYVPGLNLKFASLDPTLKRLAMLLLLLITAAGIYSLGCGGVVNTGLACGQVGFTQIVWYFVLAAIANQTSYQLSPQTGAVKAAKTPPAPLTLPTATFVPSDPGVISPLTTPPAAPYDPTRSLDYPDQAPTKPA